MESGNFTWLADKHTRVVSLERNSASRGMFTTAARRLGEKLTGANTGPMSHDWASIVCESPENRRLIGLHKLFLGTDVDWKKATPKQVRSRINKMTDQDLHDYQDMLLDDSLNGMSGLPDEVRNVNPTDLLDKLSTKGQDGRHRLRGIIPMPSVFVGRCSCCISDHRLHLLSALFSARMEKKEKGRRHMDHQFGEKLDSLARDARLGMLQSYANDINKLTKRKNVDRATRMVLNDVIAADAALSVSQDGDLPNLMNVLDWNKSVVCQIVAVPKTSLINGGSTTQVQLFPVCKSCIASLSRQNGDVSATALRNVKASARFMSPSAFGAGKKQNEIRSTIESYIKAVNDKCEPFRHGAKILGQVVEKGTPVAMATPGNVAAAFENDPTLENEVAQELNELLDDESAKAAVKVVGKGKSRRYVLKIPASHARKLLANAREMAAATSAEFAAYGGDDDEEE